MMLKIYKLFEKVYEREESALALGIFRIVYFSLLFVEVFQTFYFRHLIFDPVPYLDESAFASGSLLIIWLVVIFMIIIGLKTRLSLLINYLFSVIVLGYSLRTTYGSMHEYHIDTQLLTLSLVLMFVPLARRLSLDTLLDKLKYSSIAREYVPKRTVSSLVYIVLAFLAGAIYFDAGIWKVFSPMWQEGLGVWLPATLPNTTHLNLSFLLNTEWLVIFLSHLTVFFQVTYIFFIWFKRVKMLYIMIGIALHIGIFLSFPIPWFALTMVALYLALIPSRYYERFFGKAVFTQPVITFLYDGECPLCNRARIIITHFDVLGAVGFASVQKSRHQFSALKDVKEVELLTDVYSVDAHDTVRKGIDTYIAVLKRIPLFAIFGWLLSVPGIYSLASMFYRYVAANRYTTACNETTCASPVVYTPSETDEEVRILKNISMKNVKVSIVMLFLLLVTSLQAALVVKTIILPKLLAAYQTKHIPVTSEAEEIKHPATPKMQIKSTGLVHNVIYPLTGIEPHAVFMDYHFQGYEHIVAVVYQKNGEEVWLPIINKKGQASWYNTGRQWAYWTFRVCGPNLDMMNVERGIQRYTAFWLHKQGIAPEDADFTIKVKKIRVPKTWEHDFLNKMIDRPWMDVGTARWEHGVFHFDVANIEEI